MTLRAQCFHLLLFGLTACAGAGPTGLNVIPTTDLTPLNDWILGIQNGNAYFDNLPFYRMPNPTYQSEFGFQTWGEAGFDYIQTPDLYFDAVAFNAKAVALTEDEWRPNVAAGIMNVAFGQAPTYYATVSKTLNFAQQQDERFRAHHRRNRKLLGRRIHFGAMLDGHGIAQPMAGTDLQIDESFVFQADWISGSGNAATAGISYVFPDQKTVLTPAVLFSNDTHRLGISLSITRQFGP